MSGGDVSVRGGSDGIDASFEDLWQAAHVFETTSGKAEWASLQCQFVSHDLSAAALFGNNVMRCALETLHDAIDQASAACSALDSLAGALSAAASRYLSTDSGFSWLGALGNELGALEHLPAALIHVGPNFLSGGSIAVTAEGLLPMDPELVDELANSIAILGGEGDLGLLLSDGHPVVTPAGEDGRPEADAAPRGLAGLMSGLALRNKGAHGEIDVKFLTGAGGRRRVIVDIPGTKDWGLEQTNPDITSLVTNVRALNGVPTSYERGVLQAMKQAGVQPGEEVMLVGHSEGGMVAVQAARDAVRSGQFNVTHVVTAGSPIGRTVGGLPKSVQVLALENKRDIVPHLDGIQNPDRPSVTTVSVDHGDATIGVDHSIEDSYLPGAADADASNNTAIQAYLAGADGFFTATQVRTARFVITRGN